MKEFIKYTQEMFNELPVINERKECPSGDYSEIKEFASECNFDDDCIFEGWCNFGQYCLFGSNCEFGSYCSFGKNCAFEKGCKFNKFTSFGECCEFGERCDFKSYCKFGYDCYFGCLCRFGNRCSFAEWCNFTNYCICEFGEFDKIVSCGGFGRGGETIYFFHLTNGEIHVRSGSFSGSINELEENVKETHLENVYLALILVVKAQFKVN